MEIELKKKLFFALLATPSSGSTILINFLNSLNGSYCESEPLFSNRLKRDNIDKYIEDMRLRLNTNSIVGFKEVEAIIKGNKGKNRWDLVFPKVKNFDNVIFLIRNPIDNIDSIMRNKGNFPWGNIDNCFNTYVEFINMIESTENKIIIDYDKFCEDPINEINNKMGEYFTIISDNVTLKGIGGVGDVRGRRSIDVKKNKVNNVLKNDELTLIKEKLLPMYNRIVNE